MVSRRARSDLLPLIVADIFELAGAFRRNGESIAHAHGQTQARWQVLSAASAAPKTVPQIARRLGVSRQNVQRIAESLVRDAKANFVGNPDHRTSPHLVLTDGGRATLARLTQAAGTEHKALADRLRELDLDALRGGLRAVLAALHLHDQSTKEEDHG